MMNILFTVESNTVYKETVYSDESKIKEFHDLLYHVKVEHDSINNKIKATVYNHLNEVQTDYANPIIFEYDGSQVTATPLNGVATIDFTSVVPGLHVIKTAIVGIRNSEVSVSV